MKRLLFLVVLFGCSPKPQQTFTNPLLPSGADPWVEYYNGTYYITLSTGRNLKLYRTTDVSQLAKAESKIV